VILSDIPFLREALSEILNREPGFSVVDTAANLLEAHTRWLDINPDLILLDSLLPNALTTLSKIRELLPTSRIIALAIAETDENVILWGEAGVASYIPRTATLAELITAISGTMRNEQACSPRIAARLLHRLAEHPVRLNLAAEPILTTRELEVIQLLSMGLSNKEIARLLHISIATTKSHVHNVLTKLNLPRRSHAAMWLRHHQ
jgi:DNA-binding NarL/FixJ family response regulator